MSEINAPKVIAILVSYYPIYLDSCLLRLKKLIGENSQILIVNNNSVSLSLDDKTIQIISGSNDDWEFSAWDEGVKYISDTYQSIIGSTIIFVNDTFYEHRLFTYIDEYLFSRAIRCIATGTWDIAGEFNSFGEDFTVQGVKSSAWISTYLFVVQGDKLHNLLPFSKVRKEEFMNIKILKNKIYLPECSANLIKKLELWFFPTNKKLGWYKSKHDTDNSALFKLKVKAILNEKLVYASAIHANLRLFDVYGNIFTKTYLLGRKFLYKFFVPSVNKINQK